MLLLSECTGTKQVFIDRFSVFSLSPNTLGEEKQQSRAVMEPRSSCSATTLITWPRLLGQISMTLDNVAAWLFNEMLQSLRYHQGFNQNIYRRKKSQLRKQSLPQQTEKLVFRTQKKAFNKTFPPMSKSKLVLDLIWWLSGHYVDCRATWTSFAWKSPTSWHHLTNMLA